MSTKSFSDWFKTLRIKKNKESLKESSKEEAKEANESNESEEAKKAREAKEVNDLLKEALIQTVKGITKGETNNEKAFENILEHLGKKNNDGACECGSGLGICCMDCNH